MADYWLKYGGANVNNMTNWGSFTFSSGSTATFSFTINSRIKLEYATPFGIYVDMLVTNFGGMSSNGNLQASAMSATTSPYYININSGTNPGGWFYLPFTNLTNTYQWKLTLTAGTKTGNITGRYTYGIGYRIPTADAAGTVMDKNNKCKLFREMNLATPYSQINVSKPISGTTIGVSDIEPDVRFGSYSAPTTGSKIAAAWQNEIIAYLGNGTTRYTN